MSFDPFSAEHLHLLSILSLRFKDYLPINGPRDGNETALPAPGLEPLLVTMDEAAALLGFGYNTIYKLVKAGDLPSIKQGTARRIPLADLKAWVARNTVYGEEA